MHELAKHEGKRSLFGAHMEAVMKHVETLESKFTHRAHPFGSDYMRVFNEMSSSFTVSDIGGRMARMSGETITDQFELANVRPIDTVRVYLAADDSEDTKKLMVDVCLNPAPGRNHRDRLVSTDFAISVRLCRNAVAGDKDSMEGACIDAGVYHKRFTAEFTTGSVHETHSFSVFRDSTLKDCESVPGIVGFSGKYRFFIEIFKRA